MRKINKVVLASAVLGLVLATSPALAQTPQSKDDIIKVANNILLWVSTIFWIVAGIATLYAGFLFATAGGSQEQVGKAKKQLLYAVIAIAVGVIARGLPQLVQNFLKP